METKQQRREAVATVRIGIRMGADGTLKYTVRTDKPIKLVHDSESDIAFVGRYEKKATILLRPGDTHDLGVVLTAEQMRPKAKW